MSEVRYQDILLTGQLNGSGLVRVARKHTSRSVFSPARQHATSIASPTIIHVSPKTKAVPAAARTQPACAGACVAIIALAVH